MAKVYNLESELKDLTNIVSLINLNAIETYDDYSEDIGYALENLNAHHIDDIEDVDNILVHLKNTDIDNGTRIYQIPNDSNLIHWLLDWYRDDKAKLVESLTDGYMDDYGNLYFTTGTGYDYFDSDVLGGNGNGEATKQFFAMLNE